MKKGQPAKASHEIEKLVGSTPWEERPVIQGLLKYGLPALLAVATGVLLLLLLYRFNWGSGKAEQDYMLADNLFQKLELESNLTSGDSATLAQLSTILKQHPELHGKYDGLMAQVLLVHGEIEPASAYANAALLRTRSEDAPYYTDFAETTLIIAKQQYDEALQRSLALQQRMRDRATQAANQRSFGDTFYAFNLMRIAMLQQALGLKEDERSTWKEWRYFVTTSRDLFLKEALETFEEGQVSLLSYVTARENALK